MDFVTINSQHRGGQGRDVQYTAAFQVAGMLLKQSAVL